MTEPERAPEPEAQEDGHEGLGAEATRILATGRALIGEIGELLGLEAQLAARALAAMAILVLVAGGLALSAWLLALTAAAVYAQGQGLALAPTLAVMAAANLLLGALCWWLIIRKTQDLTFEQTRASLSGVNRDESTQTSNKNTIRPDR